MKLRSYPTHGALLPFEDFDRFFAETFGALQPLGEWFREAPNKAQLPRTDVWEGPESYELRVELPGVAREDLKIEVHNRQLEIQAEVKDPTNEEGAEPTVARRYHRRVHLPQNIEVGRIEARLGNGLLVLTIPKEAEAKRRSIEIN